MNALGLACLVFVAFAVWGLLGAICCSWLDAEERYNGKVLVWLQDSPLDGLAGWALFMFAWPLVFLLFGGALLLRK